MDCFSESIIFFANFEANQRENRKLTKECRRRNLATPVVMRSFMRNFEVQNST